jgi:hypothetical protein
MGAVGAVLGRRDIGDVGAPAVWIDPAGKTAAAAGTDRGRVLVAILAGSMRSRLRIGRGDSRAVEHLALRSREL